MISRRSSLKKIVLLDDQLSFRELLSLYLKKYLPDCEIVGEAATTEEASALIEQLQPAALITDIFLRDQPILSYFGEVHERFPDTKIVAFCRWMDATIARRLLYSGVSGIATKEGSLTKLQTALVAALNGGCYVPDAIALHAQSSGQVGLTERETEVLRLIAEGYATKEVGDKLSISVKTAEKYREKIMSKLKIHDAVRLTHYAIRHGLAAL